MQWHAERLKGFEGKTILLSRHQLFSAFSRIGDEDANGQLNPCNPNLATSYEALANAAPGKITAWFWGHEHNLCIYDRYRNLPPGRCIGYSAVPVFASESPFAVHANMTDPPTMFVAQLGMNGDRFQHGYVIVRLRNDATAQASYYQSG